MDLTTNIPYSVATSNRLVIIHIKNYIYSHSKAECFKVDISNTLNVTTIFLLIFKFRIRQPKSNSVELFLISNKKQKLTTCPTSPLKIIIIHNFESQQSFSGRFKFPKLATETLCPIKR